MEGTKLRLFDYVVILHPHDGDHEKTGKAPLFPEKSQLLKSDRILARDERTANMLIIKEIDVKYLEYSDRLEVGLRPF